MISVWQKLKGYLSLPAYQSASNMHKFLGMVGNNPLRSSGALRIHYDIHSTIVKLQVLGHEQDRGQEPVLHGSIRR